MKKGISFTILFISVIFSLCLFAEEGLHIVDGKSTSELIQQISKFYLLDKNETISLQKNLEKIVRSTFKIRKRNGLEWGTGVFVGPQGEFVTASHVYDGVGEYEIDRMYVKNGKFESRLERVIIRLVQIVLPQEFYDQVWGIVEGVDSRGSYLESSGGILKIGDRILVLGFTGPTRRKDESVDPFVTLKPDWLIESKAEAGAEELKRQLNQDHLNEYVRRFYQVVLKHREIAKKFKHEKESKEYYNEMPEPMNRGLSPLGFRIKKQPLSYDEIPEPTAEGVSPLVLSSGTIQWHDDDFVITEADTVDGMSGAPVVAISSAKLIGIHIRGTALNHYRCEYGGAALARRLKK